MEIHPNYLIIMAKNFEKIVIKNQFKKTALNCLMNLQFIKSTLRSEP